MLVQTDLKVYHVHYFTPLDFSHFLSTDARKSELKNMGGTGHLKESYDVKDGNVILH